MGLTERMCEVLVLILNDGQPGELCRTMSDHGGMSAVLHGLQRRMLVENENGVWKLTHAGRLIASGVQLAVHDRHAARIRKIKS